MSRKTAKVSGGDKGRAPQYNFLRDEATAASWLLAYGTSTIKVIVNAGVTYFGGDKVEFAGGASALMSVPSASNRIDVISLNSTPEIEITVGTEADDPTAPTPPVDNMPICEVYHKAGEVEITDEDEEGTEGYINKDLRKALQMEGLEGMKAGRFDISDIAGGGTTTLVIGFTPRVILFKVGADGGATAEIQSGGVSFGTGANQYVATNTTNKCLALGDSGNVVTGEITTFGPDAIILGGAGNYGSGHVVWIALR